MRRFRNWRDVFIIHTKRIQTDRLAARSLAALLAAADFSVWGYDDWEWLEERKRQPSWRDDLLSDGFLLNQLRALEDDVPITPPQVDADALDELMARSRIVLLLHPSRGKMTSGMREEFNSLRRNRRADRVEDTVAAACWCSFECNHREPFHLDWGTGLGVEHDWETEGSLAIEGDRVSGSSLVGFVGALAVVILRQRHEHARLKRQHMDCAASSFDLSPDEEITRARNVLSLLAKSRTPAPQLASIAEQLERQLDELTAEELDDSVWPDESG